MKHPSLVTSATSSTSSVTANRHASGPSSPVRLLRFAVVRERTGLSRSTIWRLERRGEFPQHRQLSANAVGWIEDDVNDWIWTRRMR